jgi:hypothetical protein
MAFHRKRLPMNKKYPILSAVMNEIAELLEENADLEEEVGELKDFEDKFNSAVSDSINHSDVMQANVIRALLGKL